MDELVVQLGVGGIFALMLLREAKNIITASLEKRKNGTTKSHPAAPNATREQIYQKTKAIREHQQTHCALNLDKIGDAIERLTTVAEKQVELENRMDSKLDQNLDLSRRIEALIK